MLVLLESLAFYRNARVGLVVGALFAVLLYGVRALELLGPVIDIRDTRCSVQTCGSCCWRSCWLRRSRCSSPSGLTVVVRSEGRGTCCSAERSGS